MMRVCLTDLFLPWRALELCGVTACGSAAIAAERSGSAAGKPTAVPRPVHLSHPARAERQEHLVGAEPGPRCQTQDRQILFRVCSCHGPAGGAPRAAEYSGALRLAIAGASQPEAQRSEGSRDSRVRKCVRMRTLTNTNKGQHGAQGRKSAICESPRKRGLAFGRLDFEVFVWSGRRDSNPACVAGRNRGGASLGQIEEKRSRAAHPTP